MRTPTPGPENFIAEARTMMLGGRSLLTAPDEAILNAGEATCRVLDRDDAGGPSTTRRVTFELVVQVVRVQTGADEESARRLITLSVLNLCPVNADVLPPDTVGSFGRRT